MDKKEIARELLKRREARKSLHAFIKYLNPDYIESDFSRSVCAKLDEFIVKMVNGVRPLLILGAPPQHGKTEIVSRYFPAYVFGLYPDLRIGGLSYGKDLASDINRDIQRIMLSSEYAILFPESTLNKKRVVSIEVEAKRNSDTFEIVGKKGSYVSQGVGGPLTGKKLDLGIIDDPIKNAEEALSVPKKNGIWNWYTSTFLTRLSKNSGQIIMATRWAVDDLSGKLIEKKKNADVVVYPAIDENGRALVPELHPLDKLLETKETMSEHFWSAMYQQQPTMLGGNLIKSEWWRYYKELPKLKSVIITADTAQKTKEKNDYSVFQCWGLGLDENAYLIDMIRGKWEAPDLLIQAKAFYNKHRAINYGNTKLSVMYVEDKSSGTALIQMLGREGGFTINGIQRNIDKVTRVMDVIPSIAAGRVYLPEYAVWLSDFLYETEQFPNGSNDDQVDTMIDGVDKLLVNNALDWAAIL